MILSLAEIKQIIREESGKKETEDPPETDIEVSGDYVTLPYPEHITGIEGDIIDIEVGDDIDLFYNVVTDLFVDDEDEMEDEAVERVYGIVTDIIDNDPDLGKAIVVDRSKPKKLSIQRTL